MIAAGAIGCQIRRKEYPMLIHPSPLTIALFTVRVDLLFLSLRAFVADRIGVSHSGD